MLEAINLSKHYNGMVALDSLDLEIEPGEVFCLLGANGAGKTTTINLFLNFIEPTSGTAMIKGLDVMKEPLETKRYISTYSKGMRQKVGIAIALAKKAEALLLDEPTSGLDPKASNEFSALLKKLSGQGVAALMATHDLFRAKESGTRVGIMKHRRLVAQLRIEEIGHTDLENIYLAHMHD
jgi:ABC-2 type transport system ATP-binding protein